MDDAPVRGLRVCRGNECEVPHAAPPRADGLSVAFDLPTQLGYDSDDPVAEGEVGRTGVAIDSVEDMERLLRGIPLAEVSTSMTINAPAALLLLCYELVAAEQGIPGMRFAGRCRTTS